MYLPYPIGHTDYLIEVCSLDMRNLLEQVEKAFCYKKMRVKCIAPKIPRSFKSIVLAVFNQISMLIFNLG